MEPPRRPLRLRLSPRRIGIVLFFVVAGVAAAYSVTKIVWYFVTPHRTLDVYRFFDLGEEANLPTYVSALNLLVCGLLLAIITAYKRRANDAYWKHWGGLAAGFLFMSMDEAAQFHEHIIGPVMRTVYVGEGVLSYVWYLVYLPVVLIIAALYVPFLLQLPPLYKKGFVAAGCVFIGGAIGVEMMEAVLHYEEAGAGWLSLSVLFEESFEMFGVVLFAYLLARYVAEKTTSVELRIERT